MIDYDYSTPASYAKYLASYISDPSTIRARTLGYFGKAPTLEQCRELREKIAWKPVGRKEKPFDCGHIRTAENTFEYSDGKEKCLTCYNARLAERTAAQEAARSRKARLAQAALEDAERAKKAALEANMLPIENHALPGDIMHSVAVAFNITVRELRGEGRSSLYLNARAVAIKLMRENGTGFPAIARRLQKGCHSTICHSYKTWDERAVKHPYVLAVYEALRKVETPTQDEPE
jgi:hypothetical protein